MHQSLTLTEDLYQKNRGQTGKKDEVMVESTSTWKQKEDENTFTSVFIKWGTLRNNSQGLVILWGQYYGGDLQWMSIFSLNV